jgi:hypothetical protein
VASVEVERGFEASIGDAFSRVVDLSQRVAVDQIQVIQVEAEERLAAVGRRVAVASAGAACLAASWLALVVALVVVLSNQFPLEECLLGVAGIHALLALIFFFTASRMGRRSRR